MAKDEELAPGGRFKEQETGRIYIQSSERDEKGGKTRTRLYDDGAVRVEAFGADKPGSKHSHDIDDAQATDRAWTPTYRRESGGQVALDRDAGAKRQAILDEARRLQAEGGVKREDVARLAARWRNAGRGEDAELARAQDRELRGLLGRTGDRETRGRGR